MGRKKLAMRRIENAATRQVTYAKRKDGIVKKASELSLLCDTNVAVVMFSPARRLSIPLPAMEGWLVGEKTVTYVFKCNNFNSALICVYMFLSERLKQLKYEGVMLEKIAM
ncbi:agamous-like MADS-box protein AGL104 [Primulina eburnea]|uniref:agamous-like MADS-box protein AGL104 n=1 Tax=Primulina eburnea TaxID=1245227 RepID=UPI003C6C103A